MKSELGGIMAALGLFSILAGAVIQQFVSLDRFCGMFCTFIVPHWSAWLYLGFIPLAVGMVWMVRG